MDEKEQQAVLNNFSKLVFVDKQISYDTGRSGAIVFAGRFRPKGSDGPGFTQTYVVKIGKRSWAEREQSFFTSEAAQSLKHLMTSLHDTSFPLSPQAQTMAAMAYTIAGDTLLKRVPLSEAFKSIGALNEERAIGQIETLARALVDWHIESKNIFDNPGPLCAPNELLCKMLGGRRVQDINARLREELPRWDQDKLRFYFNSREIWNPLPYLKEDAWSWTNYKPTFPVGRIHGDLHTGNILCPKSPQDSTLPTIIDFGQTAEDGVPFFDFAYLEYDILQNIFRADDSLYGDLWRDLLNYTMSTIDPSQSQRLETNIHSVERAWAFIKPIREQVNRLLKHVEDTTQLSKREDYEIAWWLATMAVGLNYARKGDRDQHRPPQERQAALFYASFGLEKLYDLLGSENTPREASSIIVHWEGTVHAQSPNPPTLPRETKTLPVTEEEQLQHYLQSLRDTTIDKVDLFMFSGADSYMPGMNEISLTEVFVWPQAAHDDLPQSHYQAFNGEQITGETSWQAQQNTGSSSQENKLAKALREDSHLVILGDAGTGKTMFLRYLLLQIIHQEKDFASDFPQLANLLPVFIDFKEYANSFDHPSFMAFLKEHCDKQYPGWDYATLLLKKAEGGQSNVLFLFDGLDAIHDSGRRSKIVQLIQSFSFASPYRHNHYIVTSRISSYTAETKVNNFSTYSLLPFTEDEIRQLIEKWYVAYRRLGNETGEPAPLLQRIRRDRGLQVMATHPLLLAMLVTMHLQQDGQRFRRTWYFQQCTDAFLDHWLIARNPRLTPVVAPLRKALCTLAFWMHSRPFAKNLPLDEIIEQVKQQIAPQSPNESAEDQAEYYVDVALQHAGILIECHDQCYAFLFYPFQEYLAAEELANRANGDDFIKDFIKEHVRVPHWREVLRMAVGIVISRERRNRNKIEDLIKTIYRKDAGDPLRPYNLLFAGQCLVDNTAGDYPRLENEIIGDIVQEYLGPSDWLRATFSPVLKDWKDTPGAREARKTLLAVLRGSASFPSGESWDKKVAYDYQDLARNNKPTEMKKRRLHIMTLLYHLHEKENVASWIDEATEDLSSTDPEVRAVAAMTLGILGQEHPQQVKSALLASFSDPAWQVRAAAAKALGSLTNVDTAILDDLRNILSQNTTSTQVKETAIMALGQVGRVASKALDIILSYLLNIFNPGNAPVLNGDAAIDLTAQSPDAISYTALSTSVMYDPSIKRSSVLTVGQIARKQPEDISFPRSKLLDLLLKAITDEDASVRQAAAIALGCLGKRHWIGEQPRIINALLIAHSDVYFPVIETAIKALEYLGNYPLPVGNLLS